MKHCAKCDINKDSSDFGKASTSKDGLQWWCKDCMKAYSKGN